jgi:hypothetical protein
MAGTHITGSRRVGEMRSFVSTLSFFGATLVIDGDMPEWPAYEIGRR